MHLLMTIIGAPPPEGLGATWNDLRQARTIVNLREIDALV
jgi:hypothetical protein